MDSHGSLGDTCLIRLPVSGHLVALRQLTGDDELLLREAAGDDTALSLTLAQRLTRCVSAPVLDWSTLAVCDLDVFILRLRQVVIGDRVRADITCQAAGCGERIDISFGINDYLMHREPVRREPRGAWKIEQTDEMVWFRLMNVPEKAGKTGASSTVPARQSGNPEPDVSASVLFRLPTVADQLALAGSRNRMEELTRRCIRPETTPFRLRKRAESAMEAMAPCISGDLRGACPKCGADTVVHFESRQFCLRELRDRAAFIYEEIDMLAHRYHWSEADILTMPSVRRANYAQFARQEGVGG